MSRGDIERILSEIEGSRKEIMDKIETKMKKMRRGK